MNLPVLLVVALMVLGLFTPVPQLQAEQTGPARRVLAGDDSIRRLGIVAPDGSLEWEMKVGPIHDAWDFKNFGNSMPVQAVLNAR